MSKLQETLDKVLSLIPFRSETELNEAKEVLSDELVKPLVGRNETQAGVVKPDESTSDTGDAKTEHPFPTDGTGTGDTKAE